MNGRSRGPRPPGGRKPGERRGGRKVEGQPQERSAGVVAVRDDAEGRRWFLLLSVRTFSGGERWEFPKGAIEPGETEEQAATREFREESGIPDIALVPSFRVPIRYFYRREGRLVLKEVVYFLGTTTNPNVRISFESTGYRWASDEEARRLLRGYPDLQKLLDKAEETLGPPRAPADEQAKPTGI